MNWITISIGILALGFGVYTIYARLKSPQRFTKLEAMKLKFGATGGTVIHVIAYTVVPILVGICFIIKGIQGFSLF